VRPLAIKLVRRERETGTTEQGKIGGHCKLLLSACLKSVSPLSVVRYTSRHRIANSA
jgi:hypothetical protein